MIHDYDYDEGEVAREVEIRRLMENEEELKRRHLMSEGCDDVADEAYSRRYYHYH